MSSPQLIPEEKILPATSPPLYILISILKKDMNFCDYNSTIVEFYAVRI